MIFLNYYVFEYGSSTNKLQYKLRRLASEIEVMLITRKPFSYKDGDYIDFLNLFVTHVTCHFFTYLGPQAQMTVFLKMFLKFEMDFFVNKSFKMFILSYYVIMILVEYGVADAW